jgi:translation initiation factor 2 subunit 1
MVKKNFPEEGENVLCTVDKILGTSVFVRLDDFGNKEAVIHISEIAPGRIRNIRDHVVPNKKIACKVLYVNEDTGKIDLSLRRVSVKEKKEIFEEYNREKGAYAIIKIVAEKTDSSPEGIIRKILEKNEKISPLLQEVKSNPEKINLFGLEKKQADVLLELIKEKVSDKRVIIKKKISISSKAESGIRAIKEILMALKPMKVSYLSSPFYMLEVEGKDYKEANYLLEEKIKILKENARKKMIELEVFE